MAHIKYIIINYMARGMLSAIEDFLQSGIDETMKVRRDRDAIYKVGWWVEKRGRVDELSRAVVDGWVQSRVGWRVDGIKITVNVAG